ncbi:MAG: hypothetical protein ABWX74_03040 [Aeromicrobium sp.]
MTVVGQTELRARFAASPSTLYGTEVPAYTTLVASHWWSLAPSASR